MKRAVILTSVLMALLTAAYAAYQHRYRILLAADIIAGGDTQRFRANMRVFLQRQWQQAPEKVTVLIGASHIQSLRVPAEFGEVINLGLGGETVADVYQRLADYKGLSRAGRIIWSLGANDALAARTEQQFSRDVAAAFAQLPKDVALDVGEIPPPATQLPQAAVVLARIKQYNMVYRRICASGQCRFIPLPSGLKMADGSLAKVADSGDHLHLSTTANLLWIRTLLEPSVAKQVVPIAEQQ